MYLKKVIKKVFNQNNFDTNIVYPIIKKGNIIQIYLYKFLKNRLEFTNIKGIVVNFKKRKNFLDVSTITIQQKLYGVLFNTKYKLNSISLLSIRVIKN